MRFRQLVAVVCMPVAIMAQMVDWPMFRGPDSTGVAEGKIVDAWNADPMEGPLRNVLWRTPIPGLSHSSPIIWKDRLFVTTAVASRGEASLKLGGIL